MTALQILIRYILGGEEIDVTNYLRPHVNDYHGKFLLDVTDCGQHIIVKLKVAIKGLDICRGLEAESHRGEFENSAEECHTEANRYDHMDVDTAPNLEFNNCAMAGQNSREDAGTIQEADVTRKRADVRTRQDADTGDQQDDDTGAGQGAARGAGRRAAGGD